MARLARYFRRILSGIHTPVLLVIFASVLPALGETADVKYRGLVDLAHFECHENPNPSFLKRVCYDAQESYLLVLLDRSWYHYCDVDPATYAALDAEQHKGAFYAHHIKGTGDDGPFDCRTHPHIPHY